MYIILLLCFLLYFGRSVPLYLSTLFPTVTELFSLLFKPRPFGVVPPERTCVFLCMTVWSICSAPIAPPRLNSKFAGSRVLRAVLEPAGLLYSDDELWSLTSIVQRTSRSFPFCQTCWTFRHQKNRVMLPAPGCSLKPPSSQRVPAEPSATS